MRHELPGDGVTVTLDYVTPKTAPVEPAKPQTPGPAQPSGLCVCGQRREAHPEYARHPFTTRKP